MSNKRVAVIDVGSNSIKMLVACVQDEQLQVLDESYEECRISKGFSANDPKITSDSLDRGTQAIFSLVEKAKLHAPDVIEIVATSFMREALNRDEFSQIVKDRTNLELRVLSGEEEASFIGMGLSRDPHLKNTSELIHYDIGGGSLEFNHLKEGDLLKSCSMPLGAVRLTEAFVEDPEGVFSLQNASAIASHVKEVCESHQIPTTNVNVPMIVTGGTVRLAGHLIETSGMKSNVLQTSEISGVELEKLLEELSNLSLEQRLSRFPSLPKNRADIVCTAIQTLLTLLVLQKKELFLHSSHGLRHGMAVKLLNF